MKCWKCGADLPPGTRFCGSCGADQQQAPQLEGPEAQQPPAGGSTGAVGSGNDSILKVFAAVCAVVYGVMAVRGLIGTLGNLFRFMFDVSAIILLVLGLVCVILDVCMCLVMVMFILKRTPQNTDGLLILLGVGGAGSVVVQLITMIFKLIFDRASVGSFFLALLGAAVAVGGVYAILRFIMGENPLVGKTPDELKQEVSETLESLGKTAGEAAAGAKNSWNASQQARQAQQQAAWQAQQAQQAQWQNNPGGYGQVPPQGGYGQVPPQGGYGQVPPQGGGYGQVPPPPGGYNGIPPTRLKTDRGLLGYILLSIITCGIYGYYFIYALARDVNVACAGDGKQTDGLIKFILLSIVTCGIYSFIWYYSLGNRLAANAPRYGMNFQENGTTVLMWFLFGSLLCGIGPFIALNIIIKNTNALCSAYNYQNGL